MIWLLHGNALVALVIDPSAGVAWSVLKEIYAMPDHRFWEDGFSYREISHAGLTGSAQVTDAWLRNLPVAGERSWRRSRWHSQIHTQTFVC